MSKNEIRIANNRFAYKISKELFFKKENVFFSPYSIFTAFAQVYIGARGETEQQFKNILNYGSQETFHELMKESMDCFKILKENIFKVANSLWVESKEEFYIGFLNILKEKYNSDVNESNYSEIVSKINEWVSEKTKGKITKIISKNDISKDLLFVLVNAVYFKGIWLEEFNEKLTEERPFYIGKEQKDVDTMYIKEKFNYYENEKYQFVSIPYRNQEFYMDILLPKSGNSLSDINIEDLDNIDNKCTQNNDIKIYLPKFKMEYGFSLNSLLENMGLKKPFINGEADFSGIAKTPNFIGSAVHKAFIEVDEKGTEAAAVTAITSFRCCAMELPKIPVIFRADHPFYFQIKSCYNEVLFLGKIEDPSC